MHSNECKHAYIVLVVLETQGNYATRDSCGMRHLMPRQHLPEWSKEEQAFVHCGSSGLNHAITST